MDNTEYSVLVSQLLAASREGRINWKESPRASSFFFSLSQNSISIGKEFFEEQGEVIFRGYRLGIIGPKGQDLDGVTASPNDPDYPKFEELHSLALRRARKIDQTLKELNQMLSMQKGEIGGTPASDDDIPF